MIHPLISAAIATERIADLHRDAARRRLVKAALRARREAEHTPAPVSPAASATPQSVAQTAVYATWRAPPAPRGVDADHRRQAVPAGPAREGEELP